MDRQPRVRLEPAVGEDWIRRVVLAGYSPNDFASWVLGSVDLDSLLDRFPGSGGSVETSTVTQVARQAANDLPSPVQRTSGQSAPKSADGWTKNRFFDYLDLVMSIDDMLPSARLLGAYLRLGPIPSSQDLKDLCGFEDEVEWQTALRVAKQRLTIHARRMDSPPLFRRAKAGKEEGQRLHPIEPHVFGWLKEWGQQRANTDRPEDAFPDPERWGWKPVGAAEEERDP